MSKKLLFSITKKDFDITYFSGSGAGGQHRNKHQNCVRLKHKNTGLTTTGQDQKSLLQNKKDAFLKMVKLPEFKNYLRIRASGKEVSIIELEKKVEEMMKEENLKIEYGVGDDKSSKS